MPHGTETLKTAAKQDIPAMRIVLVSPRGFCAGVRRAIDAVRDALAAFGPPVYVRRPIVHNLDVVTMLEAEGAVFVQELDEVPRGAVVILSAHGVSPAIARDAAQRGLKVYDAVCPLVAKVHRQVERHDREDRQVVLIGHDGHPEIEGTSGHVSRHRPVVVSSVSGVDQLSLDRRAPTAYAVQTTYSVDDAAEIIAALREQFSDLAEPPSSDICYATTNRQAAIRDVAESVDAVIVVGESFSSNARRLAEVAANDCASVQLVASGREIDWRALSDARSVAVTAAASTPEHCVSDVVSAFGERYTVDVEEVGGIREATAFKRLAIP